MREVKKNHDAPDLWAETAKARQFTNAAGDVDADNTPFSLAEIELLKPQLDEVEAYIESRQPLDDQQKRTRANELRWDNDVLALRNSMRDVVTRELGWSRATVEPAARQALRQQPFGFVTALVFGG